MANLKKGDVKSCESASQFLRKYSYVIPRVAGVDTENSPSHIVVYRQNEIERESVYCRMNR